MVKIFFSFSTFDFYGLIIVYTKAFSLQRGQKYLHRGSLMSVRRTPFKDSSTYRSVFTACLLFGDWAYVDVLTSITLLSPE